MSREVTLILMEDEIDMVKRYREHDVRSFVGLDDAERLEWSRKMDELDARMANLFNRALRGAGV